jgi:hypothetical protein
MRQTIRCGGFLIQAALWTAAPLLGLATLLCAFSCKAPALELHTPPETTGVQPLPELAARRPDAGAPFASARPASVPNAIELATAWLDALRRRDVSALMTLTQYPFDVRDTGTSGRLDHEEKHLAAETAVALPAVMETLLSDEVLYKAMRAERDGRVKAFKDGYISSWAERWRTDLTPDLRAVSAYFRTNDASFTFIFLVGESGVRALWKTGFDATVEVSFATRSLEALRRHDIRALEGLTSYPFELRDNGLEAHCGTRLAAGPKELAAALACLLDDPLFNEALKANSIVNAVLRQHFVPGFFEGWRRPEHAGLWPAMALIGTDAGNEFDLTFLVAKNGVRVIWKRGSFSPPD